LMRLDRSSQRGFCVPAGRGDGVEIPRESCRDVKRSIKTRACARQTRHYAFVSSPFPAFGCLKARRPTRLRLVLLALRSRLSDIFPESPSRASVTIPRDDGIDTTAKHKPSPCYRVRQGTRAHSQSTCWQRLADMRGGALTRAGLRQRLICCRSPA